MVKCPECCFSESMSKLERQEMAFSLSFHEHYVCDGCGKFMYMSYTGIKFSRSMETIMYHVEREQEWDLFRPNATALEKRLYLAKGAS